MTYAIKISIKGNQALPNVFNWLHEQGWTHLKDWKWFHPHLDDPNRLYSFQFDQEEYAVLFALRWT